VYQGERYSGPGVIAQGEREASVTCHYEMARVDGVLDWHGEFTDASVDEEPEPGEAQLRVGGKSATIIVVAVGVGTGNGRFEGNGPAPS
jgi:hypothetical protein